MLATRQVSIEQSEPPRLCQFLIPYGELLSTENHHSTATASCIRCRISDRSTTPRQENVPVSHRSRCSSLFSKKSTRYTAHKHSLRTALPRRDETQPHPTDVIGISVSRLNWPRVAPVVCFPPCGFSLDAQRAAEAAEHGCRCSRV